MAGQTILRVTRNVVLFSRMSPKDTAAIQKFGLVVGSLVRWSVGSLLNRQLDGPLTIQQ